jgi:hypothetical protein
MLLDDIGQIYKYMKSYKVKYGFYTTYRHTIFLKQERRNNHWVLWHSRPIRFNTTSTGVNQNLTDLDGCVSVRECFLYLQTRIIAGDWGAADNNSPNWYANKRGRKDGNVNHAKYYLDDDQATLPGSQYPVPIPNLPAPQPGPQESAGNYQACTGKGKSGTVPERPKPSSRAQHRLTGLKNDQ